MRSAILISYWIGSIALSSIVSGPAFAQEDCEAADALREAGYLDDAKAEYADLLKSADRPPECAREGLRQTFAAQQAKSAQLCAGADALRKAGYLERANAEYVELLTNDDRPACAIEGLLATHEAKDGQGADLCAAADALREAGYFEDAKTTYTELLSGESKPDCAIEGLDRTREEKATTGFARVRALAAFGLHDEAFKSIQAQLEADEQTEVPPDLQYLSGGKLPVWGPIRRDLGPWATPLLEIAAAVLALFVLLTLLKRSFARRTLKIEEFDGAALEQEHLGKAFSSVIRSQLNRMAAASRRGNISLVTGPIGRIEVPAEVAAAVPEGPVSWLSPLTWIKAIPALISWLVPERTVTLTGSLHKPGSRGVGISMQLVENNHVLASYTFWQKDFDDPLEPSQDDVADSLYQLAEYAAVWLMFEMAEQSGSSLELLGTRDWRSFTYFRAGYLAETQKREEAAKDLYIRALQLDENFRGARVNLGWWFLRHKQLSIAAEQLTRAKDECLKAADGDRDPTLYSALYSLAVLAYDEHKLEAAEQQTKDLLTRIDGVLEKIGRKKKAYRDPALKHHLESIRPVAKSMLGGLMVERGRREGIRKIEESDQSSVVSRLQYNLACGYSVLAEHGTKVGRKKHDRKTDLDKSLLHLERSFILDGSLVGYSTKDRSLNYVRAQRKNNYEELIKRYEVPPAVAPEPAPDLALAEIEIIGEEHARKLFEQNITTRDDLLQSTLDPAARSVLATKLNVTERLVTKWAHAMDLLRIVGLKPPHLKLLALADIGRLTDLAASDPPHLKALLDGLGKALGGADVPDIATVSSWVGDAKTNTTAKVVS